MAANEYYVTAGLPVAKDSGQSPTAAHNTYYVTAGLLKAAVAGGGGSLLTRIQTEGLYVGMPT